ncbi:microtubule-associated proteins 1A/1B light chain 3C isoform X2 [Paralichthys olivaceus]|uniref:microtubule-associated proteins 1A/1B light chain 3C isoform X2 n=1 Tax=Paralichthys olivaceus TaxID=8255 RepID=UPI003753CAC4
MPPLEKPQLQNKPFKLRKSFATRRQEVAGIRSKFPNKIPVIIERFDREKFLPPLDKTKFLVPHELSMTQFITIISSSTRRRPSSPKHLEPPRLSKWMLQDKIQKMSRDTDSDI